MPALSGANVALTTAKKRITDVLGKRAGQVLPYMEYAAKIEGSDSLLRRIGSAFDKNAIFDCAAESGYAWGFETIGCKPEFVPPRKTARGPDLLVSRDGRSVWVEVTRLQSVETPERDTPPDDELLLLNQRTRSRISRSSTT
jgi:hypothetical protein